MLATVHTSATGRYHLNGVRCGYYKRERMVQNMAYRQRAKVMGDKSCLNAVPALQARHADRKKGGGAQEAEHGNAAKHDE